LRIGETLKGKHNFECFSKQFNVKIKHYHADNAPFGANEFKADIANQDQEQTFSVVGAHHQNGVAERSIRTVTQWARAMLLHSILHWPEVADLKLWPFAITQFSFGTTCLIVTHDSRQSRFSPTKFQNYKHLDRCHVWGGPVFVLDPALQHGKKIPKWNPRSRLGMYLGNSPVHSSTVARVLNLRTRYMTAQYHTVHDYLFGTVHNDGTALGLMTPELSSGKFDPATTFAGRMADRARTPGPRRGSNSSTPTTDTACPAPEVRCSSPRLSSGHAASRYALAR
jgi:hypothetical protein